MRSNWKLLLTRPKWNFVHVCYIFHLIWMKFFVQEMHTEKYGWICKFCSAWHPESHTLLQGLREFLIVRFGWNYIYMWTVKQYDIFKVVNTLWKSVYFVTKWGTRWHYKLEGRGFDSRGVIGIVPWFKLSGCTVAQGSTPPVQEMSTKEYLLSGKGIRCIGPATLPPSYAGSLEILGVSRSCCPKCLSRVCHLESCCMYIKATLYEGMQSINWRVQFAH